MKQYDFSKKYKMSFILDNRLWSRLFQSDVAANGPSETLIFGSVDLKST